MRLRCKLGLLAFVVAMSLGVTWFVQAGLLLAAENTMTLAAVGTPAFTGLVSPGALGPASVLTAPVPLPRDCGEVTPPGVTPPACCVFGYVYYDGVPVLSATVAIHSAYGLLTETTSVGASSHYPYYGVDLSSAPVGVAPGDMITLTTSHGGRSASVVYQVMEAGQHVDLVLPAPWEWGTAADSDWNVAGVEYTDNIRAALSADALASQPSVQVVTTTGFQIGQEVLIIQMQGTGAGQFETGVIVGLSANTLDLQRPLGRSYYATFGSRAQVIRVPHYRSVTVGNGGLVTAHAWNPITRTGGIVFFRVLTLTVQAGGSIEVSGKGFASGVGNADTSQYGWAGESYTGPSLRQRQPNDGGGGGGGEKSDGSGGGGGYIAGGSGSQSATNNEDGVAGQTTVLGDLHTEFYLGSGGGGATSASAGGGAGGRGGGSIIIFAREIVLSGPIKANGDNGLVNNGLGGGGGAGGAIRIIGSRLSLGQNLVSTLGGAGGHGTNGRDGGDGGNGRIRIEYYSLMSGTVTSPTASVASLFGNPIATIYSISPSPAQWEQDTITFRGAGTDSDEGGLPVAIYRWQSNLNGEIGAQASFTLPAHSLALGRHVVSLTVQDNLGNWSSVVTRTLTIQRSFHVYLPLVVR